MIRSGIIGCGKIADQHARKLTHMMGCELVAVCDAEILMARQLHERFNAGNYYTDIDRFLEDSRPDVVHITTPSQTHFDLARKCLEAGAHVYVEKPFTIDAKEAEILVRLAEDRGLKLTVGHHLQFSHAAMRMRSLLDAGYLGGDPVHIESYYCYDLGDERYAKAMLGDRTHWVRTLPGKLLQNVISHGISKIAEFIESENPQVISSGFNSPTMRRIGAWDIIDELRVIIKDGPNRTAYFTFSTQFKPYLRHLRVYGPENSIIVDDDNQTVIRVRGKAYKSYLNQFIPPLQFTRQYLGNFRYNVARFLRRDFHIDSGMTHLIRLFYDSIRHGHPPPIPYKEILVTARIMDAIFAQVYSERESVPIDSYSVVGGDNGTGK